MLVFFVGPTLEAARNAARSHIPKKTVEIVRTIRLDKQNWNGAEAGEALSSVSLFGGINKLVIDDVFEESVEWMMEQADSIINGEHIVWMIAANDSLEKGFTAAQQKQFKGATFIKVAGIDPKKAEGEQAQRRRFGFVDAVVSRDKKKAWLMYDALRSEGVAAEELTGLLMWGVKSLGLGVIGGAEGLAALTPYQRSKYASAAKKWTPDEVRDFAFSLASGLHESRLGNGTADMALERLILGKI